MDPLDDAQRWEKVCWYITLDCGNCLNALQIPPEYWDLLGNSNAARARRQSLKELFLLPIYYQKSFRKHGHRRPAYWSCHEDWERRVTLIGEPSPEGLQLHWQKTMEHFQSLYLNTQDTYLRCLLCHACMPSANESTPDFRDTWGWHKAGCLLFSLHTLLSDDGQALRDQEKNDALVAYLSDPTTPSEHLAISLNVNPLCRRAIAGNPNISWETWIYLAKSNEFVDVLAVNPTVPFFLLEDPSRAEQLPDSLRDRLFISTIECSEK
jgi:hypothetical protein